MRFYYRDQFSTRDHFRVLIDSYAKRSINFFKPDTLKAPKVDVWQNLPNLTRHPYKNFLSYKGRSRPLLLQVETVNICNNLCIICAYRDQERIKSTMSIDLFKKVIQDYTDLGGGRLSLTPCVGDVFLDKHLATRLKYLETIPQITELLVTTNAVLASSIEEEELRYIVGRFSKIGISIYGCEQDEYEKMTQKKTFDKMVEGIRRIVLVAKEQIALEFRLFQKRTTEELFRWVCDVVLPDMAPEEVARKTRINSNITTYANWGVYNSENTPLPDPAAWAPSKRCEQKSQCLIPMLACIVFSNGNVSFCCCDNFNDAPELRLGSIVDSSLAELYNSERARQLWDWQNNGTPEFCKNCSFHIPMDSIRNNPTLLTYPHQVIGAG